MYYSELSRVIEHLDTLVGEPLTGIWQPERERLILGLGGNHLLLIVPKGPFSRIHTVLRRPKNPSKPYSFQGACRAHLLGRLQGISLSSIDREIFINFGHSKLIVRMTGRNGGIWLEAQETIVASLLGPTPKKLEPLSPHEIMQSPPRFSPKPSETWDEAARLWYTTKERVRRRERRTQNLHKTISRLYKKATRLVRNLANDLDSADDSNQMRHHADLLGIHLREIEVGSTEVCLNDPMDDTTIVTISLDPAKTAIENMNRLYAQSRRIERMTDHVLEKLEIAEKQVKTLEAALVRLDTADDALLRELETKFLRTKSNKGGGSVSPQFWSTWTGPKNQIILVGKNEAGNRKLITQKSRGDYIWMHIRERPGPHVVIPVKRNHTPSLNILLCGAQIAVLHAKLGHGEAVDVQYAQIRHIRPIPGDQLGRVTVKREKVLHISRDEAVLTGWNRD